MLEDGKYYYVRDKDNKPLENDAKCSACDLYR